MEPPSQAPLPPTPSPGPGSSDGLAGLGGAVSAIDVEVPPASVGVGVPDEGSGLVAGPGPGGVSPPSASPEDWGLVRRCLPEPMQALDGPGVAVVVPGLREHLDAGWRPEALREVLGADPLPDRVRHLAGLVAHRLGRIPVDAAPPAPRPRGSRRVPDPPSVPLDPGERDPVAVRAEVERLEAIRVGSPDADRPRSWWLRRAMESNSEGEFS